MVICLDRGADLHMVKLMPLPLTVSYISKIQIGFTFLVLPHPGSLGKRAVKCVCVCVLLFLDSHAMFHVCVLCLWNGMYTTNGGLAAVWLACWTQAQKGLGSNRTHDAVG